EFRRVLFRSLNDIPNRYIESVANHTRGNMQGLVDIGISYGDNIDKQLRYSMKYVQALSQMSASKRALMQLGYRASLILKLFYVYSHKRKMDYSGHVNVTYVKRSNKHLMKMVLRYQRTKSL